MFEVKPLVSRGDGGEVHAMIQLDTNVRHGDRENMPHTPHMDVGGTWLGWKASMSFYDIEDAERLAGALNNMIQQWRELNERAGNDKPGLSSEAG